LVKVGGLYVEVGYVPHNKDGCQEFDDRGEYSVAPALLTGVPVPTRPTVFALAAHNTMVSFFTNTKRVVYITLKTGLRTDTAKKHVASLTASPVMPPRCELVSSKASGIPRALQALGLLGATSFSKEVGVIVARKAPAASVLSLP